MGVREIEVIKIVVTGESGSVEKLGTLVVEGIGTNGLGGKVV